MKTQNAKRKTQNHNLKFKVLKRIFGFAFFIAVLNFALCTLHLQNALAASSSNTDYNIDIQNLDTAPESSVDLPKILGSQTSNNQSSPENFSGIKNLSEAGPLTFAFSSDLIDYGPLSGGNPVTRTLTISVNASSIGYQIQGFENTYLNGPGNQAIPDTTCDDGNCNQSNDSIWSNNLTYGFGFRCDPVGPSDNSKDSDCIGSQAPDNYRQFANLARKEDPQAVLEGDAGSFSKKSQLTFKVNASGTQKPGSYNNVLTFIAVPNF